MVTRSRRLAGVAAGGVVAAAIAVAAGVLALGRDASDVEMRRGVVARATITPTMHLFGDTLLAQIDVRVNRERVDPAAIDVDARFTPYRATDELAVERTDVGRVTRLRYTAQIRCLEATCLSPQLRRTFRLPLVRISYANRRNQRLRLRVHWPPLTMSSRLEQQELQPRNPFLGPVIVARLPALPEVTYRVPPVAAIAAALAAAVLLAIAAIAVVVPALRRREPEPEPEPPRLELPPLRRALAGLEWALQDGDVVAQRKALELLAEELETREHRDLSRTAGALAWRHDEPRRDEMTALCDRVRPHVEPMPTMTTDGAAP